MDKLNQYINKLAHTTKTSGSDMHDVKRCILQ